MNRITFRK